MPLPDAKPDRRIYELLKTVDLENLTFSDFQAVAQTIYAEQGAEDELRRIVLVNLARLSVAGEWTGLTSAGGGGGGISIAEATRYASTNERYNLHKIAPFFNSGAYSNYNINSLGNQPHFYPFLAPKSGTVSEFGITITSTSSGKHLKVGIYDTDDQGCPGTKLGDCQIDLSTGGDVYQTSISGTITLTKNTQYYIGYVREDVFTSGAYTGPDDDALGFAFPGFNAINTDPQRGLVIATTGTTSYTLQSSYSSSDFYPASAQGYAPAFTVKI